MLSKSVSERQFESPPASCEAWKDGASFLVTGGEEVVAKDAVEAVSSSAQWLTHKYEFTDPVVRSE